MYCLLTPYLTQLCCADQQVIVQYVPLQRAEMHTLQTDPTPRI